ncbi:MAG: two-component sensor histidine kinase [Bacteroidetes bacterium]|jgi:two-component system, NtrC family, sensor kinase|nr:two-component sensor histidine kinase [Bacteroidota bacterium]MBT6685972.1 two-component sensor histidine kinase [Bacteroidota bacterium]MBT7144428.1 two-component sensor histidine kinase [Bacteroidota bacterium]MBT7490853.1 two-component sensor histidine kinase [Bacteroidota bacterium]
MLRQKKVISIPLFWKFAIISTLIIVVFGSTNIYLLWSSVYTSFEKEIDKRCKVLARIVSEKALTPIVYDDRLSLYKIFDDITQSDPSISYIFILNNSGELVAQSYGTKIPGSLLKINSLKSGEYNIKVIKTQNYKYPVIRDIAYPILNGEVGVVRIGIAEEHIQQEMIKASNKLLIMIISFFVFGLLGAFFFSYIITSPIKKISQKAQVIDLGHIDSEDYNIQLSKVKIPFNYTIDDELDMLVEKFSEMLIRLKNSYLEIKETEIALIQAEKLASLGTLSAGVAHEINNPISGIKNCINRIIKNPKNIEQNAKYIVLINEAIEKIEKVVKHLLSFSRKQEIVLEKVNLNLIIEKAILLTKFKLQTSNIPIKIVSDKENFVKGSSNHLEQVFVNLIFNSVDAITERKEKDPSIDGKIEIEIKNISDKCFVHVMDNGNGIPKDIQKKIFDPFYTSKSVGKGTGLGLSVTFNLIKEHGGEIRFRSTVGLGTEFVIELNSHSN